MHNYQINDNFQIINMLAIMLITCDGSCNSINNSLCSDHSYSGGKYASISA